MIQGAWLLTILVRLLVIGVAVVTFFQAKWIFCGGIEASTFRLQNVHVAEGGADGRSIASQLQKHVRLARTIAALNGWKIERLR